MNFRPEKMIEVREKGDHKALHSTADISIGEVIGNFTVRERLKQANRYSIQASEKEHWMIDPGDLLYTNHSCNPNAHFDLPEHRMVALKPIKTGEEITFFYPSTEWKIREPFNCSCDSPNCEGEIKGAAYLKASVLKQYRLSEFIREKLAEK